MKITTIVIRILFFVSFFLPFLFLPECKGPSADEKAAIEQALSDSICKTDSISQAYEGSLSASKVEPDSAKIISKQECHNNVTIDNTENSNFLKRIHRMLQMPTGNSVSGYGIASLSFNSDISGGITYLMLLSLIGSVAGIFMLFVKKHHNSQIIVSTICFISLVIFLFTASSDLDTLNDFMWGFWVCLFVSFTNAVITIRNKRLLFDKDKRMSANNNQV